MEGSTIEGDGSELAIDFGVVRRRWYWILLPALVLGVAAAQFTAAQAPRFDAEAQVLLADTASQRTLDPSSQNTGFLSRAMENEVSLARSDVVTSLVQAELGTLPEVTISPDNEADVLIFSATAETADEAAAFANTWARQYVKVKRDDAVNNIEAATDTLRSRLDVLREERQRVREPLDDLDRRIAVSNDPTETALLQSDYDRLSADLALELDLLTTEAEATASNLTSLELQAELAAVGEARIVQVAAPPAEQENRNIARNTALAVIVGGLGGLWLAAMVDIRDTRIKTVADITSITKVPVLASVPKPKTKRPTGLELAALLDPDGPQANAYQKVRAAIEFLSIDRELGSILVTSANPSEGKSTTAANVAIAMATVGRRASLVDVDFRRARVHEIFSLPQEPGLTDFIRHGTELPPEVEIGNGLAVIPTGTVPPVPAAFVGTKAFAQSIGWLKSQTEVLLLDAPPLLAVSDGHTLIRTADLVILTVKSRQTRKEELASIIEGLVELGANVGGIVFIGAEDVDSYAKRNLYYRSNALGLLNGGQDEKRASNGADPAVTGETATA